MLVLTMLLVQFIGPREFSRFAVIQATVVTALVFAGYGPGLAATRFASLLRGADLQRLGSMLGVLRVAAVLSSVAVVLVLVGASGFLAARALGNPDIQPLILIAAIAVLFGAMDAFQSGVLVGLEAMRASAISMLFGVGLGVPATLFLAHEYGDLGAVSGLVLIYVLQAAASALLLRRECARRAIHISAYGGRTVWRELLAFTAPSMLSGLLVAPTHWLVQASLMRSAPDGVQLTVLAVAMQWFYAICFVPQAAGRVVLPVLSDMRGRGQDATVTGVLRSVLYAYALVVIPVASGVALASSAVMGLYGVTHASEGGALGLVAIAAAFASLCVPVGQAIAAEGRMWLGLAANLLWAVVFIGGATLMLDNGAAGVALALLVAYVLQFLVSMGVVRVSLRTR